MTDASAPTRFPAGIYLLISGDRTWKRPLTTRRSLSLLGSVFRPAYRQALTGLSWLSYSRPLDLPAVPGLVSPVQPVAGLAAPHAGQVERSRHRLQNPLDGITRAAGNGGAPHPLCTMAALID